MSETSSAWTCRSARLPKMSDRRVSRRSSSPIFAWNTQTFSIVRAAVSSRSYRGGEASGQVHLEISWQQSSREKGFSRDGIYEQTFQVQENRDENEELLNSDEDAPLLRRSDRRVSADR